MFDSKKIRELVLSTLIADSYCLGTHWVYDERQLKSNSIDWEKLNAPLSLWHKEKNIGEFTHYGDQAFWLFEFLEDKDTFEANEFLSYWFEKMKCYNGYIDSATRKTLENINNNISPTGSPSTDLSVVGRIVPLLKVSRNENEFLENIKNLVQLTHNSREALNVSSFFGKLLFRSLMNNDMEKIILDLKDEYDTNLQNYIQKGLDSRSEDTFKIIREFGPACDISEGFSGVIHLVSKYKNIKEMLIQNAKAGGDSSSRAMIASALLMSNSSIKDIPSSWFAIKAKIEI